MQGCITKRVGKNGVSWRIKYDAGKDPVTGKRLQRYETVRGTRKEAQARRAEILDQLNKGTFIAPKDITLSEWLEKWLGSTESRVSTKTFERYGELLRLHVIPYLGQVPLQQLQATHVQDHYAFLRREGKRPAHRAWADPDKAQPVPKKKEGLSEKSVLHVHRAFSQALASAVKKDVLYRNPCELVDAPRVRATAGEDGPIEHMVLLDRDDLTKLLRGLRGHPLHGVSTLAVGTGARRGEVLALRWADVDLERGSIRINKAFEETRAHGTRLKLPKNRTSKRTIGIDAGLVAFLKALWREQAESALKLGVRLTPDAPVFPRSPAEPKSFIRPDYVTKAFPKQAERLGFAGLTFHDLRHTHATLLLTDGVPINAVSQRLGHSSVKMTLDVYGHVLPRAEEKAVAVAGSILAGALAD